MANEARSGVYPGTFDPITIAHLEIARSARLAHRLDRVDLVVSRDPLGKARRVSPLLRDRVAVIEAAIESHAWLTLKVTDARLVTDIARGYDVVIMGADKWAQIHELHWYEDADARDRAIEELPTPAIAPRSDHRAPRRHRLDVPADLLDVSSTAARTGRRDLMAEPAARFDELTGAWSDPARYERWLVEERGP